MKQLPTHSGSKRGKPMTEILRDAEALERWYDEHGPPKLPPRDFPVKEGARCGSCDGPVDGFGCINRCADSEAHRIDWNLATEPGERLAQIEAIVERRIRETRPEFVDGALFRIYELAKGGRA